MFSEVLNTKFWVEWKNCKLAFFISVFFLFADVAQDSHTSKPSLIKVTVKLLKWELFVPIVPRLALLGFSFCQPLLVSRLLVFLQNRGENVGTGYGLIGAYAVVYFGMSVGTLLLILARSSL